MSAGSRQRVASVARALALLDEVARSDAGLGVNELARRIGVNASTASRLLATLEEGGLVERSADGPYRLGLKLVALSDRVLGQLDVRERARPWLTWLVEETGETSTLSVPGGGEAITVDFVPSSSSVVSMARVGRPSVAHATAAGKVMLAFGSPGAPAVPDAPVAELVAFTERTITDPDALAAELDGGPRVGDRRGGRRARARSERAGGAGDRARGRAGRDPRAAGSRGAAAGEHPARAARAARPGGRRARTVARGPRIGLGMRFRPGAMRSLADEELMQLVHDGDVRAFEVVFDRHSSAAFSLAYRMCGRRATAEDIVQDAFLSLWRSGSGYDARRGSVRSWVLSVVHNRAVDAMRRLGAKAGLDVPDEGIAERLHAAETHRRARSSAATTPARCAPRSTSCRPTSVR